MTCCKPSTFLRKSGLIPPYERLITRLFTISLHVGSLLLKSGSRGHRLPMPGCILKAKNDSLQAIQSVQKAQPAAAAALLPKSRLDETSRVLTMRDLVGAMQRSPNYSRSPQLHRFMLSVEHAPPL